MITNDIVIRRIDNGYIVVQLLDNEENSMHAFVGESELIAFIDALWHVNEILGPSSSRYDAERLHIGTKPGDKYEDLAEEQG